MSSAASSSTETEHLHGPDWTLVHAYGLRPDLLAMSQVWQRRRCGSEFVVAAKGAPEAIAELCRLDAGERAALTRSRRRDGRRGLARAGRRPRRLRGASWPESQHGFAFEFLGLVGLADPLRPSVPAAVARMPSAGIRVVMITGDYPATARAIAAAGRA